ncbi:bifunctional adenosylcobinamide kinase/adenosylcobinamide-phosphate guanylyltransferase [Microbulbifer salipaludis]|uniref:Bifunctional adenosylcobalamin biosynthesis protein n=1 Tax=Microbulbifer salipaludis TaxID=187980 RepID=A0ABS3E8B3_9GAMM|nr:bifunctional adenosylcobinamide kinase/adenosylcobinamide-phosphate guanylyltransferase [Microbulbifer salipaludis]MBN8431556.1 bifunctional adenosylcobinamide kinase/adenosylcobinamide-phosphate guanylyltransferase [Microbulbifer salipaludis]
MNKTHAGLHLVLGGARSGKSRLAQQHAEQWLQQAQGLAQTQVLPAKPPSTRLVYVATATAGDDEMSSRIAQHRADRDERWQTIEVPIALAETLASIADSRCVLVDCLTLWLSNCLHQGAWARERQALLQYLDTRSRSAPLIMVSNEVGSGIVPLGQLSREFVDAAGWLHQALAARAESVTLAIAGLPLKVK